MRLQKRTQAVEVSVDARRPLREVFVHLPRLRVDAQGTPNLVESCPSLVLQLAEDAEDAAGAINLGLSAIGSLVAQAAPGVTDGSVSSDAVEALGWLMADMGAVAAECLSLSLSCRSARARSRDK
jgi:hypothetical protein